MNANHLRASVLVLTLFAVLAFTASPAHGQRRVANYSTGKYGTRAYEHFSFSINEEKRDDIEYLYGKADKTLTLIYAGVSTLKGAKGFKVQLPNGSTLYVIPKGLTLLVTDGSAYSKWFVWEYEGSINGRGTFCDSCAEDEREAMKIIREYFMR